MDQMGYGIQGCIEIVSYRNSVGLLPIHHCIEIVSHRNSIRKCRLFCEKLVRIEIVSRHYFDAPLYIGLHESYIRIALGYMGVTLGYMRVTLGYIRVTLGYIGCTLGT